ncbi:rod shape-determining protein MreC [Flavobacteriaceae bacterium]|nr:rod shape-determining protein MreC [Flavobacteriaceae bacterium]MDB4133955.1 rod shape-determining protein MreC [Flavobacteriaceae bacterium]MDB4179673.1 rod shape-determining protein MreC [Flavobacteriaceae bacterium]MDC0622762.1 rod shape-determining protein MreC [Flavobacteriaceae bacterium]
MRQIIDFFVRNKNFILFLSLFSFSLILIFSNSRYHNSLVLNSTNSLTGRIFETTNFISSYLNLKNENKSLNEENTELKKIIYNYSKETIDGVKYEVFNSKVIKNSYSLNNNYLTINIGNIDSISEDMGVVSNKGIIGITDRVSKNYSRVISVLNTKLNLNAKLKKSNHFGILNWNGLNYSTVQLIDLPKQTKINIGDTIITGGNSFIFPEGVLIGNVSSFKLDDTQNYIEAEISLFNDMTNIKNVYIIRNNDLEELKKLNE